MSERPSGLYDVFETPSGKFRRWHTTGTIECMNDGVWRSIPEVAQAEISRLRSALAARTEECARVAMGQITTSSMDLHPYVLVRNEVAQTIAADIRALPSEKEDGTP